MIPAAALEAGERAIVRVLRRRHPDASFIVRNGAVGPLDHDLILEVAGRTATNDDPSQEPGEDLASELEDGRRAMFDAYIRVSSTKGQQEDTTKGKRPSFTGAAPSAHAEPLYERFCDELAGLSVRVERGVFGARMAVALVNDGPVTIVLDR